MGKQEKEKEEAAVEEVMDQTGEEGKEGGEKVGDGGERGGGRFRVGGGEVVVVAAG